MKKILFSLLMFCCMTSAWAQEDGFINVDTTEKLWNAIKTNDHAKVRLTADFALSDINKDGETYCNTFYGTIDGNGHTIKGDPVADIRSRTYMFTYCDGATIKNLTFKGIRIDNRKNHNQAVIASQAKNGCVFENITFDHISTYVGDGHDNTGAVAGYATTNCTFTNITVKNSDFTADQNQSGAVVGHAMNCKFTNIKVEHCESTARKSYSGGVAGRTDNCTINNVEVSGSFIKTDDLYGGGVVGYSENTRFTNCIVDDQSCVCVDGVFQSGAYAGGMVGYGSGCNISNCINSALIAADQTDVGGIVGGGEHIDIVECLNTGMVIDINIADVKDGLYNKYKTKTGMTYVTKTYQGKEYVIRKYEADPASPSHARFAGIAGYLLTSNLYRCVNWGSINGNGSWVGGIVGYIKGGTISDCLSDFSGSEDIYGICAFEGHKSTTGHGPTYTSNHDVTIKNCLNMTTYKDFNPYDRSTWTNFSGSNNYSLTTASDAKYTNKTTVDKIKSGEICLKLGANWEQNLGTDESPTPTGSKGVYHTRTVSNQYGTVCFPFPVQSDDNIRYYTFSKEYNGDDEVLLMFDYAEGKIPAGTPLLFRVRNLGENSFNNVAADSNDWADEPISKDNYDSWDSWNFLGTFYKREFSTNAFDKYYVSDGVIKNAKQTTVPAYRAYFRGPDIKKLTNSTSGARVRIVVEDEDGETTAISLVNENYNENENFGGKAYSLMGTEVNDSYRGIVIRNGKKYINR